MNSNPLAEHNAGIALSSKQIPVGGGGTGNMYQGQAGRAFVQGGGGMSQFHSFDGGNADSAHARGSYAPVTVGYNSVTSGGGGSRRRKRSNKSKSKRKVRKTGRRNKKCGCDIVTGFGGRRSSRRMRTCRRCKSCRRSRKQRSQSGGSNAAFSIAGSGTEVGRNTTALVNPAPYTAYNSCHPVL
jgi:hypothetical protein